MATAESVRPGQEPEPELPDIVLIPEHLDDLITGVIAAYRNQSDAEALLRRLGYPPQRVPNFGTDPNAWNTVFNDLANGIIRAPYRRLLLAALRVFTDHPVLRPLAVRYGVVPGGPVQRVPEPEPTPIRPGLRRVAAEPAAPTCHVIIRASGEDERVHAEQVLAGLGLEPHQVWSTSNAVSFRVGTADAAMVRGTLDRDGADLGWTVVAAGEPDYLLQSLYIEGPDRRRFVVRDAPAQQTIRNLATEIVTGQYPQGDENATLPITVDHVRDGQPHRVDPDQSLHEAQIRDGDTMRVGYQTNAGSVHPMDHEDALYRVHNQIRAFADGRAGFAVRANSAQLPTEYELRFTQRSIGPGERDGDDPVEIDEHVVIVQLGPDFPREPPTVWWESPIFHPNVFPNYGEQFRLRPQAGGRVCLGILAESWQPSWDFGDLCQMVVDMAAFRSYGILEDTGSRDARGKPVFKVDFYDLAAAVWVYEHPEVIRAIGGDVKTDAPTRTRVRYPNVIEPAG